MTASTPVESIVALLTNAGYRRLPSPLSIAGLSFDLPAALIGTGQRPDLVIVADTALEPDTRIQRRLESIARALDVVGSKRPMTAILAGPKPGVVALEAMAKVCRVLPIGTTLDSDIDLNIRNWIAILLPLDLPATMGTLADPLSELKSMQDSTPETVQLMAAAVRGEAAVETEFRRLVNEPLAGLSGEDTP